MVWSTPEWPGTLMKKLLKPNTQKQSHSLIPQTPFSLPKLSQVGLVLRAPLMFRVLQALGTTSCTVQSGCCMEKTGYQDWLSCGPETVWRTCPQFPPLSAFLSCASFLCFSLSSVSPLHLPFSYLLSCPLFPSLSLIWAPEGHKATAPFQKGSR